MAARYVDARRSDVRATALCSLAAQLLVERSASWSGRDPVGPARLTRALRGLAGLRPSLVHRLALASRQR
ncbi:MAG: hypothetical protein R2749_16825 [Acidimicrobiales bacterium]